MNQNKLLSVEDIGDIKNKVILLRADYNVHYQHGVIMNTQRIDRTFGTIDFLISKGAKIIILSHIGRPKGEKSKDTSLKIVWEYLKKRYKSIVFSNGILDAKVKKKIKDMSCGDILLLENLRYYNYETNDDELFAKKLAELGDYYINDAFGVSHRKHSSIHAITRFIPSYAGFNLINEIKNINLVLNKFTKPACSIIGGVKISTKIRVIEKFCSKFEKVLIGGALANNFLINEGYNIGNSFYEKNYLKLSKSLLNKFKKHLVLPKDVVISRNLDKPLGVKTILVEDLNSLKYPFYIVDIGPKTIKEFIKLINLSQTLVWNGPMGKFELKKFSNGTFEIAKAFAKHVKSKPFGLVGGGETISVIDQLNLAKKIDFISTGGGAMLEYIEKGDLPAFKNLYK